MKYIIVNGEILKKEEINLSSFFWSNPVLLTDHVWFGFGGIPLLEEKLKQIIIRLQSIGADIPDIFHNYRELFRRTKRMLNKNRFYRTGLINYQILISSSAINFILSATPYEQSEFIYHETGKLIRFADIHKYSKSPILTDLSFARFFDRLAGVKKNDPQILKSIFLNERGMVCDAGIANLFFIKKNILITPALATGCVYDNLRDLILEASKRTGLEIVESDEIIPETIYTMNEIFFAAESTGIQWVLGIGTKRFVHPISIRIHAELNELLKSKVN